MTEAEILFPVQCPVCAQEALTGFRISVVADALRTGEIRLDASPTRVRAHRNGGATPSR